MVNLVDMFNMFAHAGEVHESLSNDYSHSVLGTWYFAIPIFLAFMLLVIKTTYLLSGKSYAVTYNIMLAALFVSGVLGYKFSPAIAVISISLGFAMALLSVLGFLAGDHD